MLTILMPRMHDPMFMEINSGLKTIIMGVKTLIRGFTVIEISWNSGNLPSLVANIYGLNFIKIGGTWIFRGAEAPYNNRNKLEFCESALFSG